VRAANRRQHYVPQMYLKRFTEDGFHIYQFDTNTQKSKRYHIRNVCFEDHFYTSAELGSVEGSDPEFECWLSRAESKAGEALKHLLEESSAATDQSSARVSSPRRADSIPPCLLHGAPSAQDLPLPRMVPGPLPRSA